jgi:hypothetical protein
MKRIFAALVVAGLALSAVGCQTETTGMTLPQGKYLQHAPQYIPPDANFPVQRELVTQPPSPLPPKAPPALGNLQPIPPASGVVPASLPGTVTTTKPAAASLPAPAKSADPSDELITLLNETKSVDTFLLSLQTLVEIAPDHPSAIPAAIKNAERLELQKGIASGAALTAEQDTFKECLDALIDARKQKSSESKSQRGSSRSGTAAGAAIGTVIGGATGAAAGALIGGQAEKPR